MHLKSLSLRDWKAYSTAKFDFPSPIPNKNLVLVGAQNGFGKTSFFEAVVLGLFGKDGMPLIARAAFADVGAERLTTSYRGFMEKAINRNAVRNGRTSCSVTLVFGLDEENEEEIEIKRIWNFSDSGAFKASDEEIQIFEGARRKPVGPHAYSSEDRAEWFRDYVAKTFLPYYLAAFFLFDGEQVSTFAEREMSAQVQNGIEGLLGIPVLRELASDLRNYARDRRRETPSGSNGTLARLEQDRDELNARLAEAQGKLDAVSPNLLNMSQERERITRELDSYGTGSQAQLQEQLSSLNRYDLEAERAQEQLHALLAGEVSIALAGRALRDETVEQLRREEIREGWEAGRAQGDRNLERFVDMFADAITKIQPALQDQQATGVREAIGTCWESLWHPPPEDSAEKILHVHLTSADRQRTRQKLADIAELGSPQVLTLVDRIIDAETEAAKIKESISRLEGVAPQLEEKRDRLRALNSEIDGANKEVGGLRNEVAGLTGQIETKNKDIARLGAQMDQAQPALRRATRGDRMAALIDEIVKEAVPSQIAEIASAMTAAHRTMAHKKDLVERVDIDEACNVRLLNSRGDDVRDLDLSAGEKQIFTQALISAVAQVSGRVFPMLIDTPLGRLDVAHRRGVLQHLVERKGQVILLSTNTEVVGEYYELVRPHVLRSYVVEHDHIDGVGSSAPREGYFESEAR